MKQLILLGLAGWVSMQCAVATEATGNPMLDAVVVFNGMQSPDIKSCLDSGFRRHTAMMSFLGARASDEKIHESMIAGVTDQKIMDQMEDEYKVWTTTHKTQAVAQRAFENCLVLKDLPLKLGDYGKACFSLDVLPSLIRSLKLAGTKPEKARKTVDEVFGKSADPQLASRIFDDIYSNLDTSENFMSSHLLFRSCLQQMVGPKQKKP